MFRSLGFTKGVPSRCSLFCLYEKPCLSSRIAGLS
nr:MAG TPA: hypothetical protein [Caudoviricetes sp.]